ncbi:hypothetical protein FRC00_006479, partial [Tulasnella sp. 408]
LKDEEIYGERRGGFGDVRVSTLDPGTPAAKLVATKVIRLRGVQSEPKRLALRLARELKVWAELHHPRVLPLLGYYLDMGYETAILISEYMPCGDLKEYIDREDPPFDIRLSFILTGLIPYANLKSEPALILALMQEHPPAGNELLGIPVPEIRELLTRCWTYEPEKRPSVGDCYHVVEKTTLSTEAAMLTSHQGPSKSPEEICTSVCAEKTLSGSSLSNIFENILGEDFKLSPHAGQKRSNDEPPNPPKPRKRIRLTFQDELHTRRAAELAAARQLGIEESLDFLDQAICNYQAVAATSSPPNITEPTDVQGVNLPTIESLVQMFDQPGVANCGFLPSYTPENVPDLDPSTPRVGQIFLLSPLEEADNWIWAIGSSPLAPDTPALGNLSELVSRPVEGSDRCLFEREDVSSSTLDARSTPAEETVRVAPDWDPLAETSGWQWDGKMEPNGEWPIDFRLT